MRAARVTQAFKCEAARLSEMALALDEVELDRPTGCQPWTVRELLAHIHMTVGRVPDIVVERSVAGQRLASDDVAPGGVPPEAPAAGRLLTAAQYYRSDHRFSLQTDADRICGAQRAAAAWPDGHALAVGFDRAWRAALRLAEAGLFDRVVTTRHGDLMLLTDFLVTRIVELAVHGLDLAAALGRAPWLTDEAADVLEELLSGRTQPRPTDGDRVSFVRKATGREPISASEAQELRRAGATGLAFSPTARDHVTNRDVRGR